MAQDPERRDVGADKPSFSEAEETIRDAELLKAAAARIEDQLVARVVWRSIGWIRALATAAIGIVALFVGKAFFDDLATLRAQVDTARASAAAIQESFRDSLQVITRSVDDMLAGYRADLLLLAEEDSLAERRADLLLDLGMEQAIRVAGDAARILATRNDSLLEVLRRHISEAADRVDEVDSLVGEAQKIVDQQDQLVRRPSLDSLRVSVNQAVQAQLTGQVWVYDDNSKQIPGLPLVIAVENVGDERIAHDVRVYHRVQMGVTGRSSPVWGPTDVDFRSTPTPVRLCVDRTEYKLEFLGMIDGDGGKQTDGFFVTATELGPCTR